MLTLPGLVAVAVWAFGLVALGLIAERMAREARGDAVSLTIAAVASLGAVACGLMAIDTVSYERAEPERFPGVVLRLGSDDLGDGGVPASAGVVCDAGGLPVTAYAEPAIRRRCRPGAVVELETRSGAMGLVTSVDVVGVR